MAGESRGSSFDITAKTLTFCVLDAKTPPPPAVFSVNNIGSECLDFTATLDADHAPFVVSPARGAIAPGASANVTVTPRLDASGRFTSPTRGPFRVAITAANGASTNVDVTVGVDLDALDISSTAVDVLVDLTNPTPQPGDLVVRDPTGVPALVEVTSLADGGTTGVFRLSTDTDNAVSALALAGGASTTLHVNDSWVGSADRFRDEGTLVFFTFAGECPAKRRNVALHARARDRATALAAGGAQTCARGAARGQNYCWGDPNLIGRTANDPASGGLGGIGYAMETSVVAGRAHACQLLFRPECWGRGQLGQLGDGMLQDALIRYVEAYPINPTTALYAGFDTTCAVVQTGAFLCWGRDPRVTNATSALASPTPIALGPSPSSVGIGAAHVCGVGAGSIACIGANDRGQLGDGTNASATTATMAVGIADATSVTAGDAHTCALHGAGRVSCWGDNARGQLGVGTFAASSSPTVVPGITDATAIAAGAHHTCALRQTGTLVCWGANESGEIGDGTTNDAPSPVAVSGLAAVTIVATGHRHTCAVHHGGDVSCWGDDSSGQLGNGTGMPGSPRATPQRTFGFY